MEHKIFIIILAFLLMVSCVVADNYPSSYVISGDMVYVNDSNVYMSATPHTTKGRPVVIELMNKMYSGDVNIAFGYPTNKYKPKSIDMWDPHIVEEDMMYTCEYEFGYTTTPENRAWCYINNIANGTIDILFNHTYDHIKEHKGEIYWTETYNEDWGEKKVSTKKVVWDYEGVSNWHIIKKLTIEQNENLKMRLNLDFPHNNSATEKYWVCIYPDSYNNNIYAANLDNMLYCLDPWTVDADDVVAYWKLEDLTDATGNGYTLSNEGATSGATGIIDDAYSFDGDNDNMDGTMNVTGFSAISISAWVNITDYDDKPVSYLVNLGDAIDGNAGRDGIALYYRDDGDFNFIVVTPAYTVRRQAATSTGFISDDTWYHLVGVYNGTSAKLYVDGVLKGTDTTTAGGTPDFSEITNTDFSIGSVTDDGGGKIFFTNGTIDEVIIFDVALTQDEIDYLYNGGSPGADQQYPFGTIYYANYSVSVNSPDNNSYSFDQTPDFNFTVSGTEATYDCDLRINGTNYGGNTTVDNNTATIITANTTLEFGDYYFDISCDQNNTENDSVNRYFDIRGYTLKGTLKYSNNTVVNGSAVTTYIRVINQTDNSTLGMTSVNETGGFTYGTVPIGIYGLAGRTSTISHGGGFNPHINVSTILGWFT